MKKIIYLLLSFYTIAASAKDFTSDLEVYKKEYAQKIAANNQINISSDLVDVEKKSLLSNKTIQAISSPEFVLVANRNPQAQTLSLYLTDGQTASLIGTSKVSTGTENRKEYFLTPTGLFENKPENGNYRALGTKNEHGVRGLGTAGMRIYDLGWQDSIAGWGSHFPAKIRMQIHATDPDLLEQRLGTRASKGCIRIHHDVNKFIDDYGVLDKNFPNKNQWPLSKTKIVNEYEGRYIMIIDEQPPKP